MKTAAEILNNRAPYSVSVDQSVWDTINYMVQVGVGAVIVVDEERVVGIFSERDLLKRIVLAGVNPRTTAIGEVMTANPSVCAITDTARQCMERMEEHHFRHLPVVDGDQKLVGLLSMRDLLHDQLQEAKHELSHLHTYLHGYSPSPQDSRTAGA